MGRLLRVLGRKSNYDCFTNTHGDNMGNISAEFKDGDVVQLKSGGPLMTIKWMERESDGIAIYCEWFDGKKLMGGKFRSASVEKSAASPVFS